MRIPTWSAALLALTWRSGMCDDPPRPFAPLFPPGLHLRTLAPNPTKGEFKADFTWEPDGTSGVIQLVLWDGCGRKVWNWPYLIRLPDGEAELRVSAPDIPNGLPNGVYFLVVLRTSAPAQRELSMGRLHDNVALSRRIVLLR